MLTITPYPSDTGTTLYTAEYAGNAVGGCVCPLQAAAELMGFVLHPIRWKLAGGLGRNVIPKGERR